MGSSREETRELLEQLEEAHKQTYAMFEYARVPFARKWKWEINGRNPFGGLLHVPQGLTSVVKTEDAAQMLCFVYTKIFFGFTIGEVAIMLEDPAKADLERYMKLVIDGGKHDSKPG